MPFSRTVKDAALVACGRHCCICHKLSGTLMECHHITPEAAGGDDSLDNCIPLCLNCHGQVEHYNPKHPKGNKYTPEELRGHRESWYAHRKNIGRSEELPQTSAVPPKVNPVPMPKVYHIPAGLQQSKTLLSGYEQDAAALDVLASLRLTVGVALIGPESSHAPALLMRLAHLLRQVGFEPELVSIKRAPHNQFPSGISLFVAGPEEGPDRRVGNAIKNVLGILGVPSIRELRMPFWNTGDSWRFLVQVVFDSP